MEKDNPILRSLSKVLVRHCKQGKDGKLTSGESRLSFAVIEQQIYDSINKNTPFEPKSLLFFFDYLELCPNWAAKQVELARAKLSEEGNRWTR